MSQAGLPSWTRRLRWLVLAALLLAPPVFWWTSSHFRLVVYELAYPRLSSENQKRAFERIRNGEGRPDVAWRCYAEAAEDPGQAWSEVFEACWKSGPFEFRGLEDDLVRVLGDPRLSPAHDQLFLTLIECRVKDPRLPALLMPYLEHRDLRSQAACSLVFNGRSSAALPTLTAILKAPPKSGEPDDLKRLRTIPMEVFWALVALRAMGPEARPALPAIRPWAELDELLIKPYALAALRVIEGEARHRDRLRAFFRDKNFGPDRVLSEIIHLGSACLLAEIGDGDDAVRQVLERQSPDSLQSFGDPLLEELGWLGAAGASSLPLIKGYLDHPDPAIRSQARQAIDAIENDRRGRR